MPRHFRPFGMLVFLLYVSASHGTPPEIALIPVSLAVQETCVIQSTSDSALTTGAEVLCLHGAPYSVTLASRDPEQPVPASQVATPVAQRVVWTVAF
jgi:hypothetical protein